MVNNQNQNQQEQQREITNIQKAVLVEHNDSDKKGHGREQYQVIISIWMENPVEGLVSVEVVSCEYVMKQVSSTLCLICSFRYTYSNPSKQQLILNIK